ncbi:ABC transporter permease [Bacillus thuringiensis]|uniref:ABC transporter permease n=1 Tax=Bacillus thuringiensis TaxID=1428 RepID=UPI0027DC9C19|nr:ABC transporter permease [Bacillus thuringiensis]
MDMPETPKITEEDIYEIKKVPKIAPILTTNSSMESLDIEDKKEMVNITGLDSEYFSVNKVKLLKGRSLQESDVDQGNNVVMISKKME